VLLTPQEPPLDRAGHRPLRIVVADDAVLLREGLVRLLAEDGHQVVAVVGDGPALVDAVLAHRPDVSVVDVRMPPTHTDEGLRAAITARTPLQALTARERQLLALMAEGHSNTAIAQRLVLSASAVEKHIGNIFAKLGLPPDDAQHRRVLAVLAYLRA
jgi:DNA-binding NarL/FixJ family response regulator